MKRVYWLFCVAIGVSIIFSGCGGGGGGSSTPIKPLPKDYALIRQLESDTANKMSELLKKGTSIQQAVQEVSDWLKNQSLVKESGAAPDGHGVWMTFPEGQKSVVTILESESDQAVGNAHTLSTLQASSSDLVLLWKNTGINFTFPSITISSYNLRTQTAKYNIKWTTSEGKVSDFAKFKNYALVYVTTHSGFHEGTPIIVTGEEAPVEEQTNSPATQEWIDGVVVHMIPMDPLGIILKPYYCITPEFVLKNGNFKSGSLVVFVGCQTYPAFTDVYNSAGATTVLGWSALVRSDIGTNNLYDLSKRVCPDNPEDNCKTVYQAWSDGVYFGLGLKTDEISANIIPIVDDAYTESTGAQAELVVKGRFGTQNKGQILAIKADVGSWFVPIIITVDSWSKTEARAKIPGNIDYGEYLVRVQTNEILSNAKRVILESPSPTTWTVASHHPKFSTSYAYWDQAEDQLFLIFLQGPGVPTPFAEFSADKPASSLRVGVTVPCSGAVVITEDDSYVTGLDWPGDENPVANLRFTQFELKVYGKVSGRIEGTCMSQQNPELGPLPLKGSFENVMIITQEPQLPAAVKKLHNTLKR